MISIKTSFKQDQISTCLFICFFFCLNTFVAMTFKSVLFVCLINCGPLGSI